MSESVEKRVLALKYRPHRFEDLVGQSTVSQTLSLALDSNRLSHAYLFSGLRGSGKTSTARIMAKALLCSNGPTSKPCEVCDNCKSANASRHLDIIEMDAASNRGIDDIKDLIEHTKYKPSSARFKVFIIDEVHMLTTQAFNALLKTLEEPPGFVKFILATTDPLKLPATILSRTQHFRFNKISNSDVIHHLSHILNEEGIDFESEALEILARSGQGSLRDTLTMLDQAIIFSKGRVTTTAVVDMLGLIDPEVMDTIFQVVLNKGDITAIVKELENYEVSQVCDEMTIYLKHRMLEKDSRFDLLLYDRFFRILSDAKHLLAMNSDGGFVLILTLMKMIEAVDIRTIDEIINQVQKVKEKEEPINPKVEDVLPKVQEVTPNLVEEVKPQIIPEIPEQNNTPEIQPIQTVEEVVQKVEQTIQSQIEQNQSVNENPFDNEPETKIEEATPQDLAYANSLGDIVDLGITDAIETVSYPTPFDDLPTTPPTINTQVPTQDEVISKIEEPQVALNKEVQMSENNPFEQTSQENTQQVQNETVVKETNNSSNEIYMESVEQQVAVNPNMEVEAVPFEEEVEEEPLTNELYEKLTKKVYDRDYSLGECFEKNFIFNGYEENKLYIISRAQGEDRKFLYKHFGLIRTFAQDVYGNEVELDFTKEQARKDLAEIKPSAPVEPNKPLALENNSNDTGSMLEDVEVGSGCVADMQKVADPKPSQRELQLNDILNSPMLNRAKELLDVKKITVKSRS
ncbi:DNA polymerase III subunit gamma/tau [Arcobacter sp. YIC-464]|uniref:DNA polymerase III subunit gamma/tau n=1 Tax=Arcobacter sp. YIC-464 TaxID=3376631 RepID=UPI003C1C3F6B